MRHIWRRFKPRGLGKEVVPQPTQGPLWARASAYVNGLFPGRKIREEALVRIIQSTRDQAIAQNDSMLWCAALMLQAPRASRAQEQMDQHPHGYHNKQARLYELIDFNDTFVSAVLSLPESDLPQFVDEAKRAMDVFCKRAGARCFSNEQYEAIVHGLSREIAVYRGATKEGFQVRMTSRVDDALGIDMVITDPTSGGSINVDCKTSSAFYYRLKDLEHEGRLTSEGAAEAEEKGYCYIVNGDETRQVEIALLRIDEQTYGAIQNFSFDDTVQLGASLRTMINESSRLATAGTILRRI